MKSQIEAMTLFRVHHTGGEPVDIEASSPDEARKIFNKRYPRVIVEKVKRVKGGDA